mmetsp:Transcript_36272/g.78383  ORF Transcript_36272/g.78383 Transcript_36272/m.78383 type:complete len:218 (+) Transcript_36272:425-1078(+)
MVGTRVTLGAALSRSALLAVARSAFSTTTTCVCTSTAATAHRAVGRFVSTTATAPPAALLETPTSGPPPTHIVPVRSWVIAVGSGRVATRPRSTFRGRPATNASTATPVGTRSRPRGPWKRLRSLQTLAAAAWPGRLRMDLLTVATMVTSVAASSGSTSTQHRPPCASRTTTTSVPMLVVAAIRAAGTSWSTTVTAPPATSVVTPTSGVPRTTIVRA